MPQRDDIRVSLEVGFDEASPMPERFVRYRGRQTRSIPVTANIPFEDAQFDAVIMSAAAVNQQAVKEAHRVLRPSGKLLFRVPEKTKKQDGFTLPDIYSVVRYGFDIVGLERQPWWYFGTHGRYFTICARKKSWRELKNTFRPYV